MKLIKMLSTTLAASTLAGLVLSSTAHAAVVAPKGAALFMINHDQGTCPADGTIRVFVAAKKEGTVQIRFQRKSDGVYGPWMIMQVKKNPNYGQHGLWKHQRFLGRKVWHPTFGAPTKEKFRVVAQGAGKTKASGWTRLVVKC